MLINVGSEIKEIFCRRSLYEFIRIHGVDLFGLSGLHGDQRRLKLYDVHRGSLVCVRF